jgi:hypothetical protein
MTTQTIPLVAATCAIGAAAVAQPTIDGKDFDGEYAGPLFSQTIGTQFGNNNDPDVNFGNGSEINGFFATIQGGTVYFGVSGNLETNFNKLDLFFDVAAGGQNVILDNNADVDFNAINNQQGLTFDKGFEADYFVTYTNGVGGGGTIEHYLSAATMPTGGMGVGAFVGGGEKDVVGAISGIGPNGGTLVAHSDNSNILGVGNLGDPFDSDPASVFTGYEFSIGLDELGWDGVSTILIAGYVNGGGHDFLSNQVLGGLPDGFGNLAAPGGVNFAIIDGNQYIVIPAPASASALLAGGVLAFRRRR